MSPKHPICFTIIYKNKHHGPVHNPQLPKIIALAKAHIEGISAGQPPKCTTEMGSSGVIRGSIVSAVIQPDLNQHPQKLG